MSTVEIHVQGLDRLLAKLESMETVRRRMDEPTGKINKILLARAQFYPPPPAGSRYVRTFRLRHSWQARLVMQGDELGRVESTGVKYNIYVQDYERQADIHRGRWDTNQMIAQQEQPEAQRIFYEFIEEAARVG